MSLTKTDLLAIGDLIDQKLEEKLETKLEEKLNPIWKELTTHTTQLKRLERKVKKIDWTVSYISKTFDERIVQNVKDIDKIKSHIGFSTKH